MKIILLKLCAGLLLLNVFSCEEEIRNIADVRPNIPDTTNVSAAVVPVDINTEGFDLLENMQGHWVGANRVIADDFDWFAFDYRAISPSQIHGIFEGGAVGNLLTSFFVTDFKDTRTIMARNGGLLNGIYRSSYFVLDSVSYTSEDTFYRLVDAEGGKRTMWMELRFTTDSLYWNAYTSRLGLNFPPSRHMTFRGVRSNIELAEAAALATGFPQNIPAWDFSNGFVTANLQASEGAKSATFLAQQATNDVFSLALESGDPFRIDQHPYLAYLQVDAVRNPEIENKPLLLYLSKDPLTDEFGYFSSVEAFNTILLFPGLLSTQDQFLITYLHPGDYYVTIIADSNEDGFPSEGDFTHTLKSITIAPEGQHQITIDNINIQN